MLPDDDVMLLRMLNIINEDMTLNLDVIKNHRLVLLYSFGIIWLQPFDKEIILPSIEIITDKYFLQKTPRLKLDFPFKERKNNYVAKLQTN